MSNKNSKARKRKLIRVLIEKTRKQGMGALRSLALEVGVPYAHVYNDCGPEKLSKRIFHCMISREESHGRI
jgi:hypothetical protein